ncbi:transport protein Trs120 or TRAPPC9 TRAPP II complex subunit-domain-containing protein [Scleroderma citrinum]
MSSFAFASLAHVRILLIPVGPIPRDVFETYATEIRAYDSIRLVDIPGDAKGEKARFMPNPLSSGYLHLSFSSHPNSPTHDLLYLFRPSLFNHAVIGVAAYSSTQTPDAALEQMENILADISSDNSVFPLSKMCFMFQNEDVTNGNIDQNPPDVVLIPSAMGNKKLYIGTLLADLCSQVLGEFGRVVQVLETSSGNEHLNSTLFPVFPIGPDMPSAAESHPYLGTPPYPSYPSQLELTSNVSVPVNQGIKRNSSVGVGLYPPSGPLHRQSTLGPPPVKKRLSTSGATSSHARLYKVYGDFFLLAGRTQDAQIWYQEALNLFKAASDPVWQASVIEGLAVISVLDLWASGQGLQTSISDMKEPWMEIYDQLSQVITLYLKSPAPLETPQDYSLLAFTYTVAVLRQTSLLFCVWSSKGWGALAFVSMLQPGSTSYLQKIISDNSLINLERLSAITGITRSQIASTLSQAHGPWLLHLDPHQRLVILESMASIYNCLGFKRKEIYVLREVISCIMDLIVCGREEDDQLRKSDLGSAGLTVRTGLPSGDESVASAGGSVGVRRKESLDGNQSVLKLLYYTCKVLGVNLESVNLADAPIGDGPKANDMEGNKPYPEDLDLTKSPNVSFGWPELQVGVIREAIAVAEALPASRALNVLKRRGETTTVEWWAGRLLLSIALMPLPSHRFPCEQSISLLASGVPSDNSIVGGVTDLFLYNPRKSTNVQGKCVLVQGEIAELTITLHNPFVFDLELQSVSLITSGVTFECNPFSSVVIRSNSIYKLPVSGIAKESGTLVFKGCIVLLPICTEVEEDHQYRRRSMIMCESERTKYTGLDSLPWESGGKRFSAMRQPSKNMPRYLECVVVPEQPLLRVRWTSLTHGALMLYNGETSSIRLTLENVSVLSIDFLRLSFEDSTIAPATRSIGRRRVNVFEAYETEYDLTQRKVFSWDCDKEVKVIAPGRKIVLSVTCLGKVGCTSGAIHVSYAHLHGHNEDEAETFYTRQLTYPVNVTVYHMLECYDMNIMPMGVFSRLSSESTQVNRMDIGSDSFHHWCLFSVEVRNTYGLPFEVTFVRSQDGTEAATRSSVVPPGSTSSLSKVDEEAQREFFWYREELFKVVHGRWKEQNGSRFGDLSFRQQRMTIHMLNALRTDLIHIDLSFTRYEIEDSRSMPLEHQRGHAYVPPNMITNLRVRVINTSPSHLDIVINLSMSPEEHILYEGVLMDIPLGKVDCGQLKDIEVPICFLCMGQFEVGAEARILGIVGESGRAGVGWLRVIVNESE